MKLYARLRDTYFIKGADGMARYIVLTGPYTPSNPIYYI